MVRKKSIILILLIILLYSIWLVFKQLEKESEIEWQVAYLTNLFGDCQLPCWNELVVGQTTEEEFLELRTIKKWDIQVDKGSSTKEKKVFNVKEKTAYLNDFLIRFRLAENKKTSLENIYISLRGKEISYQAAIEYFGEPDFYLAFSRDSAGVDNAGYDQVIHLIYEEEGMIIQDLTLYKFRFSSCIVRPFDEVNIDFLMIKDLNIIDEFYEQGYRSDYTRKKWSGEIDLEGC